MTFSRPAQPGVHSSGPARVRCPTFFRYLFPSTPGIRSQTGLAGLRGRHPSASPHRIPLNFSFCQAPPLAEHGKKKPPVLRKSRPFFPPSKSNFSLAPFFLFFFSTASVNIPPTPLRGAVRSSFARQRGPEGQAPPGSHCP